MTAPWSVNRLAALAVAMHAGGTVAERRELLEALGLVEPGGRTVTPDDTKVHALVDVTTVAAGRDADPISPRAFAEHGRRPAGMTTPPGLANLPPIVQQPKPEPKQRPVKRRSPGEGKPQKSRATKPPREVPECGSYKAYRRHKRRGEDVDEPCTQAARAHWRSVDDAARRAAGVPKVVRHHPAPCGTRSGYERHRREHTAICGPCRAANSKRSETDRLIAAGVNPDTATVLGEKASA